MQSREGPRFGNTMTGFSNSSGKMKGGHKEGSHSTSTGDIESDPFNGARESAANNASSCFHLERLGHLSFVKLGDVGHGEVDGRSDFWPLRQV